MPPKKKLVTQFRWARHQREAYVIEQDDTAANESRKGDNAKAGPSHQANAKNELKQDDEDIEDFGLVLEEFFGFRNDVDYYELQWSEPGSEDQDALPLSPLDSRIVGVDGLPVDTSDSWGNQVDGFKEVFIEEVILKEDWPKPPFYIHIRDILKFKEDASMYLHIHIRNWRGLDGWDRQWKIPTTVRSWFGDTGFVIGPYDAAFWIDKYKSYCMGRYNWDIAISPNKVWDEYIDMRMKNPSPRFLAWTCPTMEDRDIDQYITWNHQRYENYPKDFDVRIQVIPNEPSPAREKFGSILRTNQCFAELGYWEFWKKKMFSIYDDTIIMHFRERSEYGSFLPDLDDLGQLQLYKAYPALNVQTGPPHEWLVYREKVEDDLSIDPKWNALHSFTNYDVRGGEGASNFSGQQYVIANKLAGLGGSYWWYPRNYGYEMKRGMRPETDPFKRKRQPLYERMMEFSHVDPANEPKPPWRKSVFQELGFFMDQFQFQVLPYLRRIRVALDVMTMPFSYKDEEMSRLDGTFWIISRASRILDQSNFENDEARKKFLEFIDTEGKNLEKATETMLEQLKVVINIFKKLYSKLQSAKISMENAQLTHWQIMVGRHYLLGLYRLNLFQGFYINKTHYDPWYGVPKYYSLASPHKREIDEYHHYNLEQFPCNDSLTSKYVESKESLNNKEPKSTRSHPTIEIPPKPVFVPFDPEESTQRVPYNFHWLNDSQCHVHLPLEGRCINLKSFDSEGKIKIFKHLFQNSVDMINISRQHFFQAHNYLTKKKAKNDLTFMTPTGPKGVGDKGYQSLFNLMNDPSRANPFDTVPLQSFDELMEEFSSIVGEASSRFNRHMLGPGAYRMIQTVEQIFDLHHEMWVLRPHLFGAQKYLKNNIYLLRGLAKCRSTWEVTKFVAKRLAHFSIPMCSPLSSSLLRMKNRYFYIVRFSMPEEENAFFCSKIPKHIPDTLEYVKTYMNQWTFVHNGYHDDWVSRKHKRFSKKMREMRLATNLQPYRFSNFDIKGHYFEEDKIKYRTDYNYQNPYYKGPSAVRRNSSCDLWYVEDDRPAHFSRFQTGRAYKELPIKKVKTQQF